MASRGFSLGLILIVAATIITSSRLNFIAASSLPLDAQAQLQPAPPLQPAETSPIKPNAVIKFIGVKHGFGELQQARSAFEQKVQLVIGQPLTIDLFDPMTNDGTRGTGLIEWHSLDMNDCNEDRIRQLLAKFKNPAANGWTREFKMEFGPDFDMPEQIAFEWRNECAANYQKRTLEATSSTTTTTTTGAPATTLTPEPVTNPPEAPSTTTEAPMTTPEPPVTMSEGLNMTSADTSEDAANSSETPTTTSSETTTSEFSMISFTDFNSTLFPITPTTTTTTTEAAATTTTSFAEVGSTSRETSTSETRATSSETPTTTIAAAATTTTTTTSSEVPSTTLKAPTSTEEVFIKAFEDLSATSPEESENDSLVDSASSTAIPLAEETPALNSSGASSSPHYGKYIGLTTGFFVFIAYLLCARAYRRQGMYELHEST